MKKALFLVTGLAWGVFLSNEAILWYAIFLSFVTILIEILVED